VLTVGCDRVVAYRDCRLVVRYVELALAPGTVHVRDSKHTEGGPRLALTPTAWADFVACASGS
jgi:hypothetical protein